MRRLSTWMTVPQGNVLLDLSWSHPLDGACVSSSAQSLLLPKLLLGKKAENATSKQAFSACPMKAAKERWGWSKPDAKSLEHVPKESLCLLIFKAAP